MNIRIFIVITVLALTCCVLAQSPNQRPPGATGKVKVPATTVDQRVEKFSKAMGGLSVKQKARLKTAIDKYFAKLRTLAQDGKLSEIQRLKKQNEYELQFNAEVRSFLSPEQKKKFDKMVADAKKRKQSGMKPASSSPTKPKI